MSSPSIVRQENTIPEFLSGGGELGRLIREYDWTGTPLGGFEEWPQSLRTCVRIMLTSRQPIWIGWGKELIKFYNDPYKTIVGGKHPWALGKPASLVWQEIWKDIEPMLRQVMEKDEGTYVESQPLIMERNGYPEETYYTFSYTPIPGDNGGTEGMICANSDDTSKVIGERQLKTLQELSNFESKNKTPKDVYRAAAASLSKNNKDFPFAVIYQIEHKGLEARPVAWAGIGADQTIFPAFIDLYHAADDNDGFARAFRTRQIIVADRDYEGEIPTGGWDIAASQWVYIPINNVGGEYPHAILAAALNPCRRFDESFRQFARLVSDQIAIEITDVLAYEEERRRAEALAEIDRAKTTFFSNISHEFRTPLTLLLGPIEDVLNDPNTPELNKARLGIAHRNSLRLQKLVNSLLDFSRIEARRMKAHFDRVEIAGLTRDIASSFRSVIEKGGLEYVVDCQPLPGLVAVDVDMWENIVLNIISNAYKYTNEGTIAVRLVQSGGGIEFSVRDTGVGIPHDELGKIFERFHRVENIQGRTQEGTGIGLSLVKELVKLLNGDIHVQSELGRGSVFTVFIPKIDAPVLKEEIMEDNTYVRKRAAFIEEAGKWTVKGLAGPDGEHTGDVTMVRKPRVLVADDNADMRDYIHRLLQDRFLVELTTNGEEAYRALLKNEPDLVLSDVMMPVLDGFGLLGKVRANHQTKHIPFVFLSARAGEEAKVEGLESGADDYMVKPFSGKELIVKVDANIRISRARQAAERNLYNLFMQAPVGIGVYRGAALVVEMVNDTMLSYWGRVREETIGRPLWDVLPEAKAQGFDEIAHNVYQTGITYISPETAITFLHKGKNKSLYVRFTFEPMRDENGVITGLLGVANDVTQQVLARKRVEESGERLEKLVAERTAALQRSNDDLQQFAHVASHDLKEPVRKLRTFGNRLQEEFEKDLPEKAKLYISKMEAAANRMAAMIDGVLLYSSLESVEEKQELVDLNEVIRHIEMDLEVVIAEKGAHILYVRLPLIQANPLLIYQLFYNLLSNSLKFSREGVIPQIKVTSRTLANGNLEVTVKDNGIGFRQANAEKIFKTFSRLNTKDKYEGTGLGLALCKKIVERHQGQIRAEGYEGEGAAFIITLPDHS